MPSPNGYLLSLTQTQGERNWVEFELGYDAGNPPWPDPLPGGYSFRISIGPAAVGPFALATLTGPGNPCSTLANPTGLGGLTATAFGVTGLTPDTDYWFQIEVQDETAAVVDTWVQGPFATAGYPSFACLPGVPGQTSATVTLGSFDGALNIYPPCMTDGVIWELATNPAGPWTAAPRELLDQLSPSHTFTGLTPSTAYYYRARFDGNETPTPVQWGVSPVCAFTTAEPEPPKPEGPCEPWPFDPECCPAADTATPERILKARTVATQILWALSGRRYGPGCPVAVRPCKKSCFDSLGLGGAYAATGAGYGSPWIPYLGRDGLWRNASVCGCAGDCSCGEFCEIYLPGPVYDIVEVNEGGTVLPAGAYRVDNGNTLVRTDGNCWPDCQDMAEPPGAPNTLTVTYRVGVPLDALALNAMDAMTCHLLSSCTGAGTCSCKLPSNVTRLNRQGVEQTFESPTELLAGGLTGIADVDRWLLVVNPYRQYSPSRVYSPDFKTPRVTTRP